MLVSACMPALGCRMLEAAKEVSIALLEEEVDAVVVVDVFVFVPAVVELVDVLEVVVVAVAIVAFG